MEPEQIPSIRHSPQIRYMNHLLQQPIYKDDSSSTSRGWNQRTTIAGYERTSSIKPRARILNRCSSASVACISNPTKLRKNTQKTRKISPLLGGIQRRLHHYKSEEYKRARMDRWQSKGEAEEGGLRWGREFEELRAPFPEDVEFVIIILIISIIHFIIDFIIKNVNIKNYNRKKNGKNNIK